MSLAIAAKVIPGMQELLEASHTIAMASPANGGGIKAAVTHLKDAVLHMNTPGDNGPLAPTVPTPNTGCDPVLHSGDHGDSDPTDGDNNVQNEPASKERPICRSLWKGRLCEDPASCDRAHKPLCAKEACKSARDPTCHDWHYIPKKRLAGSASQQSGNSGRGRSAPKFKSAATTSARRISQENEKLYFKWKLSEMKLKQFQQTAATYKDILLSTPSSTFSHPRPQGPAPSVAQQLVASALGPPPAVPSLVPAAPPPPEAVNLGSVVAQLEAITKALTVAGIMKNVN